MKIVFQGSFLLFLCFTWCYQWKVHLVKDKVDLITETCKKTAYFDICAKTLRANPKFANSDVDGLAIIIFEEALSYSNTIYTMINELITKTRDKDTKGLLTICSELYDSTSVDIPEAIRLLKARSYTYVIERTASSVSELATFCKDGFHEAARPSPLTTRNTFLDLLWRVALEIVELIIGD